MKHVHRPPSPFNTLALAFAACEGFKIHDSKFSLNPESRNLNPAAPRGYPLPPWRKSTPTITPPPPPLARSWTVEVSADARRVFIPSTDRKTGKEIRIPTTVLVRTATLTSGTGHSYEASTTSRMSKTKGIVPGSTVRVMSPRDCAMRASLADAIAEIEAHGERVPGKKPGTTKLSDACKAEIASLRRESSLIGTRHLPDAILADLCARIGAKEAEVVVDFLFSK